MWVGVSLAMYNQQLPIDCCLGQYFECQKRKKEKIQVGLNNVPIIVNVTPSNFTQYHKYFVSNKITLYGLNN